MTFIPVKIPRVAKRLFPNYVWDLPSKDKTVFLTFDDGPTPDITSGVLNTLQSFEAKATFFCIGKNIEAHPDLFKGIVRAGHAIGNHTYNHIKGWKTSSKEYLREIEKTQDIIHQMTSVQNPPLFRPPYGQITPKQGKALMALGYHIIMWDIISFDWDQAVSPEACLGHVTTNATNGSVIVFHDSVKASRNMQYALPKALEHFSENGYRFATIP